MRRAHHHARESSLVEHRPSAKTSLRPLPSCSVLHNVGLSAAYTHSAPSWLVWLSDFLLHDASASTVARRKTLFDDRPVEISELTYIIKHDIAAINKQLADLQAFNKANKSGRTADRAEEHRGNVVTLLQSKLAGATTSFQDILEVRTQNMKASKDRSEQFMFSNSATGVVPGENSGRCLDLETETCRVRACN